MTLATLLSRTPQGLEAPLVRVEVDVGNGLPAFSVVGLLETAVKESKDRVRAALANCGYEFPGRSGHRQPRPGRPAEGGRTLRPRHRDRHPDRLGSAAAAVRSTAWNSTANFRWAATCMRHAACCRVRCRRRVSGTA